MNEKKVCGILTEMKTEGMDIKIVAIGFGINNTNKEFTKELKEKATSLYLEGYKDISSRVLIANIIKEFENLYQKYEVNDDLTFMVEEYNSYLIKKGEKVIIETGNERFDAVLQGINENGFLIVNADGKETRIASGEVSIRGVLGYV